MQPVNENLASYSELFMLIAALIYLVAFFAFAWDVAASSATIRRLEKQLAETEGTAAYAAAQVGEAESVEDGQDEKVLAHAGAGIISQVGSADGADSSASTEATGTAVDGPRGRKGKKSAKPLTPEQQREAELNARLVNEEMEYSGVSRPVANVAVALFIVATAAHAFAVITRGIAAGRVPWSNLFEFMTSGALVVSVVYLVFLLRKDLRFVGIFVSGLVLLMMTAATIGFPTPVANEQPALQSWWLVVHVSVAVAATGIFTLTASMSILQLIKSRSEATSRASGKPQPAYLRFVPSALALENWSYRLNAVGFVMWTFTLIAGAIWAEQAWGRYWGWDAKEVWSFVIWVVYAGYLHARATRGWTGTRAAWLNLAGFTALVFNYTIVNIYFPSLHSYAGV